MMHGNSNIRKRLDLLTSTAVVFRVDLFWGFSVTEVYV